MGARGQRKRNRSDIVLPKTALQALKAIGADYPVMRRPSKGQPIPKGVRLMRYGKTAEERLMELAPEGSAPEKMVYGWLVKHGIPFEYQVPLLGGRVPGGAIVDFVLELRETPLIIRVMGYYHTLPAQIIRDEMQRDYLEQLGWRVEDVWDYEVNTEEKVNEKMIEVIYGFPKPVGLGGRLGTERSVCPRCGDPDCEGGDAV